MKDILLIVLFLSFVIPFLDKFIFNFYLVQLKEYRLDRLKDYLCTRQGFKTIFNPFLFVYFWLFILFFFSFVLDSFSFVIYLFLFVFVLFLDHLNIFRKAYKKISKSPKITKRLLTIIFAVIILEILLFKIILNPILFLLLNYIFVFWIVLLAVLLTAPLAYYLKNKNYKKAKEIIKKCDKVKKIAVTWSYGKTSVKDFVNQILSRKYSVLASPKNINTEMGISNLIINNLDDNYDYLVAELGAYRVWEIKTSSLFLNQDYAFLTAIGNQHIGLFGSMENIIKAKTEIIEPLLSNAWVLYVNFENEILRDYIFPKDLKFVSYWLNDYCDAYSKIKDSFMNKTIFEFNYKKYKIIFETNIIGEHNIINLTWVIAFAFDIGIKEETIKEAIKNLSLWDNFLRLVDNDKNIIFKSTYNLSLGSLNAWLDTIKTFKEKKVLILDDILELWKEASSIHYEIGKKIWNNSLVDYIIYVGLNYKKDFIRWLVDSWFEKSHIKDNLLFVDESYLLLFEWRGAEKLFKKFVWKQ